MKKIIYGLILILLTLPHSFYTGMMSFASLIPLLGYVLVFTGIYTYKEKSRHFLDVYGVALVLTALSVLLSVIRIANITIISAFIVTILRYLLLIGTYFLAIKAFLGFQDVEAELGNTIHAEHLLTVLMYLGLTEIVSTFVNSSVVSNVVYFGMFVIRMYAIFRLLFTLSLYNRYTRNK